jgi:competence protein ComEC
MGGSRSHCRQFCVSAAVGNDRRHPTRISDDQHRFPGKYSRRTAISLRMVAWAATFILLITPEAILGANFQMSFGAVVVLVAVYEILRPPVGGLSRRPPPLLAPDVNVFRRCCHDDAARRYRNPPDRALSFQPHRSVRSRSKHGRRSTDRYMGNAMGGRGRRSHALRSRGDSLVPMMWGLKLIVAIATGVASWERAVHLFSAMPVWGLGLIAIGGLWLCLWRQHIRWFDIAVVTVGVATMPAGIAI